MSRTHEHLSATRRTGWLGRAGVTTLQAAFTLLGISADPAEQLYVPCDLIEGDSEIAAQMYRGVFALAGTTVTANGASPFAIDAPSRAWRRELEEFAWLRHLSAADNEIANAHARALVRDWISLPRQRISADPGLTGRRILSWLRHGHCLGLNRHGDAADDIMHSLVRQVHGLSLNAHRAKTDRERLGSAAAVAVAALCLNTLGPLLAGAEAQVAKELRRQIFPDGGHRSRNPAALIDLMFDLLPLREAYIARGMAVPDSVQHAIDRIIPMIRLFLHGDAGLAHFGGNANSRIHDVAVVMAHAKSRSQPLVHAPHSGFQRLSRGAGLVLVDTGPSPDRGCGPGCLGFELSDGKHRIVTNHAFAMAPDRAGSDLSDIAGLSATLCLDRPEPTLSRRMAWLAAAVRRGTNPPGNAKRSESKAGVLLEACRDGVLQLNGLRHRRSLFLSDDGLDLRGEDVLLAPGSKKIRAGNQMFQINFPLDAAVKATAARDGGSILMVLANRVGWQFSATGATPAVEPCVTLADDGETLYGSRIVLRGGVVAGRAVKWSFKRISKRVAKSLRQAKSEPMLPLG